MCVRALINHSGSGSIEDGTARSVALGGDSASSLSSSVRKDVDASGLGLIDKYAGGANNF